MESNLSLCYISANFSNGSLLSQRCYHALLTVQHAVLLPLNVMNIVFSALTLATIGLSSTLHTIPNALIGSLALSDGFEGIVALSVDILFFSGYLACSRNCENVANGREGFGVLLVRYIVGVTYACNYFSLFLISTELWFYICKPFLHQRLVTPRLIGWALGLCFTLSLLLNLYNLFMDNVAPYETILFYWWTCFVPAVHIFHSILICTFYLHITVTALGHLRIASRRAKAVNAILAHKISANYLKLRNGMKAFKMFFMAFGVYFITLSPYIIYKAIRAKPPSSVDSLVSVLILESIPAIHYVSNFFVFGFLNKDMNQAIRRYLCRSKQDPNS